MARQPKEQAEETHSGNGKVTLESLAQTVVGLADVIKSMQQQIRPEDEFAPDDKDLREEAAATAKAIMSGETGINVSTLGKSSGKNKASEMLVGAMFDTPDSKLDEMTDIGSNLEAAAFAGVRTINEFVLSAFTHKPGDPPVMMSNLFLNNLFKLNRSINGRHMTRAMAMSQIEKEKEEARENSIVFGSGSGGED